jgi:putative DNA primase/helicase
MLTAKFHQTDYVNQGFDETAIRAAYELIIDPSSPVFVQSLPSGVYAIIAPSSPDELISQLKKMPPGMGFYWGFNPIPPMQTLPPKVGDVISRIWLMIDVDPIKAEGKDKDNATDEEHQAASTVATRIKLTLSLDHNFPSPIVMDSGNGWYLFYRIDLPNTPHARALLARLLKRLKAEFAGAKVDTTVVDARRIAKIPGTWARRGPASDDRPHRICRIVERPQEIEIVSADQIAEAAGVETATTPPPGPTPSTNGTHASGTSTRYKAPASVIERARRYIAKMPPAVSGQNGHTQTFLVAEFLVRGFDLGIDQARPLLHEYNARCLPPWTDAELEHKLRQADEAGEMVRGCKLTQPPPGKAQQSTTPPPAASAVPKGESIIIRASDVKPRKVEWLWAGRIPLGKLTTFAGQGGLGKTFVMLDIAARVTRGTPWPDAPDVPQQPGQVLFLSGEDDPDDTLVPRLIELGADLTKVAFLRFEVQDRFTLADLATLDLALEQIGPGVRFVGIDPPACFLGEVDDHRNAEVRSLLSPLKSWAGRHRLATVFNTHFTKSGGGKIEAVERVMASVAWVNAVRAAHAFAKDPDDESQERVFFLPMKMNLGKKKKALAYRILETNTVTEMAKVDWLGEVDMNADDAVNRKEKKPVRKERALEWLILRFREKLEWLSESFFEMGKQEGISRSALFEAKAAFAICCRKDRSDGLLYWYVPADWPYFNSGPELSGEEEV